MHPPALKSRTAAAISVLAFAATLGAETVKDREGAVRGDKARLENDVRWHYNDFDAGFRRARETGKPLLVVLRWVPCLACAGIDAGVLEEAAVSPLVSEADVHWILHQSEPTGTLAGTVRRGGRHADVTHAGEYGEHAAAKNAGFRQGDIVVQIGALQERLSESALIGHLLRDHRPGENLPAVVIRGSERMALSLPQQ